MQVLHTTDSTFDEDVVKQGGYTLVDFWAEWCGPCRSVAPILDELASIFQDQVRITKINIDENPDTPMKFGVRSIPTLILFKDGKPLKTQVGALPRSALEEWVRGAL